MRHQPSTPEQRARFWPDIEHLLEVGFLSTTVLVDDVVLCIRNPMRQDFWLSEQCSKGDRSIAVQILSRCIWMIEGISLLEEKNTSALLYPLLEDIHPVSLDALVSVVMGLNKRYKTASHDVHCYVYENISRKLWINVGRRWPCTDMMTGIPGSERLGVNNVQQFWFSWNEQEDKRKDQEWNWNLVKNQMAPHAPKGVQKLDKKDKQYEEKRAKEYQKILDTFYYTKLGTLKKDESIDIVDGTYIRSASSVDELQEDMRKWVAGELDEHDKIVASYKAQVLKKLQDEDARKEERLRMVEEERRRQEAELGVPGKPIVGYTLDQIKDIQRERGHNPDKPNVGYIGYASRRNYARDKWLSASVSKGSIVEFDGRLITRTEYERITGTKEDLQSKVMERAKDLEGGDE